MDKEGAPLSSAPFFVYHSGRERVLEGLASVGQLPVISSLAGVSVNQYAITWMTDFLLTNSHWKM
jgi:hypothetical protein